MGIRARGLVKRLGGRTVLCDLDVDVGPGQIVTVVGPNGAGKSTLLRILATTLLPDAGSAHVAGHDVVRSAAAARRSLGLVITDDRSWYWRLSGRENLAFFARLHGLRAERPRRVAALLEEFGLGDAAERVVGEWSTGMRARLSLARALLGRPSALLLDEPTRSVDPEGVETFHRALLDVTERTGAAALLVTHDLAQATALCPAPLTLADGRLSGARPVLLAVG